MLLKTHLVVGLFLALLFLPSVNYKFVFFFLVIFASIIPELDSAFSAAGKNSIFKFLNWITKYRAFLHSFTFCILISIVLGLVYPPMAFPIFLGYSIHLFMDSFTVEGIRPFWPLSKELNGKLTSGGKVEYGIFVIFCILDVIFFLSLFLR